LLELSPISVGPIPSLISFINFSLKSIHLFSLDLLQLIIKTIF
jgi:hypothetical protein